MHSTSTGSPGTKPRDSIGRDLPEDVQHDVDRVADVVAAGFTGPVWQQMADELYAYAFVPLMAAMRRTDTLMALTADSMTPLTLTSEDGSTLYRSAGDRERLAILTISVAMETFPQLLKKGGYDPARNRGRDGRPARLTSFFYGRCGLVFPRVFYTWKKEHTDRFLVHAAQMGDGLLAHALGQTGPETVPADVADLCDTLTAMINRLKPRDRAVWIMTVDGLSQGEIADVLGIKVGDVENARYGLRSKVRNLRRRGELPIPEAIEAEWARTRARAGRRRAA